MAAAALVAVLARAARPAPPPKTLEGLATFLGHAARGEVRTEDVFWEGARGVLSEALLGRRVLFLAGTGPKGERDLFRARLRVSAEGQPIDVADLRNLTETPLGDDAALELRGTTAAFATTAFGRVQGVTVLDLDGVSPVDAPKSFIGRMLLAVASYGRTGSLRGIGRTDVVLDTPARGAKIALEPPRLTIGVEEPTEDVTLDLKTADLRSRSGAPVTGLRAIDIDYSGRSTLTWSVDLVRNAIGATPMAWFEDGVFAAQDLGKRAASKLFHWSKDSRLKKGAPTPTAHVLEPSKLLGTDTGWPPEPIPSLWEAPKPGEGRWAAVTYPFLPKLTDDPANAAPSYFYTTFIRPDPERPFAEVLLIAMDMRQLELGMEGGYEEPEPVAGPPGTGRIPRVASVLPRTVAAFNGAFKAEHGAYGMMVGKRILLPPVPGAATVLVMQDGSAGFGTWPASKDIPDDVSSFRQNLDPLVDGGLVNPSGRSIWGWQVAGESTLTERTALCLTPAGHVYYAWGRDVDGPGLGRALKQAGCEYAVHLDMNPRHCGFAFFHAELPDGKNGSYRLADNGMSISPNRYVLGSDKDFFYVMLRNVAPADKTGAEWTASAGAQPPPTFLPGIYEATENVGELEIHLYGFDPGRVDWIVRAGAAEPSVQGAPPKRIGLEPELEGRVVASVGLGDTTDALRYGLAFGAKASLDLRQSYATVVLAPGRAPLIAPPGERPALLDGTEAVQLPLLADRGKVDPRASDRGGTRDRGALCVTPEGRVLVALARHDSSDPLAAVLVEAGCTRVVALDRGSRHPAFVHRASSPAPPLDRYDTSVLYALGRPMTPHAFLYRP